MKGPHLHFREKPNPSPKAKTKVFNVLGHKDMVPMLLEIERCGKMTWTEISAFTGTSSKVLCEKLGLAIDTGLLENHQRKIRGQLRHNSYYYLTSYAEAVLGRVKAIQRIEQRNREV